MSSILWRSAFEHLPENLRKTLEGCLFRQLIRFAVAGLGATLFSAAAYLTAAYASGQNPFVATAIGHCVGLTVSYTLHSRWSFSSHEDRSEISMMLRFGVVSSLAFGLNSLWVAITTVLMAMPNWAPVPLMVSATPLVSFLLNRTWVFHVAGRTSA